MQIVALTASLGVTRADYQKFRNEIGAIAKEADQLLTEKLGRVTIKVDGSGAEKLKREVSPLTAEIRELANEAASLRNQYQANLIPQSKLEDGLKRVKDRTAELIPTLGNASREVRQLSTTAASAERTLDGAAGRVNKLGLAYQTNLALQSTFSNHLSNFGPLGHGASMGIDAMGGSLMALSPITLGVTAGVVGITAATAALVTEGRQHLRDYFCRRSASRRSNILSSPSSSFSAILLGASPPEPPSAKWRIVNIAESRASDLTAPSSLPSRMATLYFNSAMS